MPQDNQQEQMYAESRELQLKSAEILDKSIFSLSSIFIGVIVGFMKEFKTLPSDAKIAMIFVIGFFLSTIFITLCSYKYGIYEQYKTQENALGWSDNNLNAIYRVNNILSHAYFSCFCLGIVSLFVFCCLSI